MTIAELNAMQFQRPAKMLFLIKIKLLLQGLCHSIVTIVNSISYYFRFQ